MGFDPRSWSVFSPSFERNGTRPADLLVCNARVLTCDDENSKAEAVAVKDQRIVYVGGDRGAGDYVGPETEVVDGKGRVLTPGLIDNHCHVLYVGGLSGIMTLELLDCETQEEVKNVVRDHGAKHPELPFVLGLGWKHDYLPKGIPHKSVLDEVTEDRPVILMSYTGQSGWVNSRALEVMNERNPRAFENLVPHLDESGELTGYLQRYSTINYFEFFPTEEIGETALQLIRDGMTKVLDDAVSYGVTTMNDAQVYPELMPLIVDFRDRGGLQKVRVRCSLYAGPRDLDGERTLEEKLRWWKDLGKRESDDHLVAGDSLKLYVDGVPESHTALLLEPYSNDPGNYGEAAWQEEGSLEKAMEIIDGLGLQACTHCCGDAGIRRLIDAYQHAIEVNGSRDARHRLDHCEMPNEKDIPRMAELGIYAAMQPNHFFSDETKEAALGSRVEWQMPWRTMEEAGVEVSFGTDWAAGPLNPVYGLLLSATRMNYRGKTDWCPQEAIEPKSALRHFTIDSARALFMEDDIGSIEMGKFGDMVLWNQNPLKLDSWWFLLTHKIELGYLDDFVDKTFLGGKQVYDKEKR